MKRPDHPDFWTLSRLVIDQDNVAEGATPAEDQFGRIVDPESITYMAHQRALRARGMLGLPAVDTSALMAVWLDAFMLGAAYQGAVQQPRIDELADRITVLESRIPPPGTESP